MADYSYVFNAHPSYIEEMYKKYVDNPSSVEDGWRSFFQGFDFAKGVNGSVSAGVAAPSAQNMDVEFGVMSICLLYTSPSPRDQRGSRMPSSA